MKCFCAVSKLALDIFCHIVHRKLVVVVVTCGRPTGLPHIRLWMSYLKDLVLAQGTPIMLPWATGQHFPGSLSGFLFRLAQSAVSLISLIRKIALRFQAGELLKVVKVYLG